MLKKILIWSESKHSKEKNDRYFLNCKSFLDFKVSVCIFLYHFEFEGHFRIILKNNNQQSICFGKALGIQKAALMRE